MNLAAEHKVNWRVRQKTPKFSIHTAFVARFGKIKITTLYARDIYLFILCLFRKYLLSRFMCTLRSFSVSSWNVQYFFIRSISFVTFGGRADARYLRFSELCVFRYYYLPCLRTCNVWLPSINVWFWLFSPFCWLLVRCAWFCRFFSSLLFGYSLHLYIYLECRFCIFGSTI